MINPKLQAHLAQAVIAVRAGNPQAWDELMRALVTVADDVTDNLVSAPPERLQEIQGRARMMRDLLSDFANAPKLVADLKTKREMVNGTRPQPQANRPIHNPPGRP